MAMPTASSPQTSAPPRIRGFAPSLTLVFLSPFIAEVLSGATKVSVLFALIPEMLCWGCGALLIREAVRRWRGAWPSTLMLGLGLSIAEEFLIQQTSLAPLPFPHIHAAYARLWGVNWLYFLFMLGFESVWVVLVPIGVTELFFPVRRGRLWLRTRGMIVTAILFLLGCRIAWYAWIKRVRPIVFHLPAYHPAGITLLAGLAAIVLLGVEAYLIRGAGQALAGHSTPPVWIVGAVVLVLGFPWYGLMVPNFSPTAHPQVSFWMIVAAGVVWGAIAYALFRRWTASGVWTPLHTWAAAFAAAVVCMVSGFSGSSAWSRLDFYGKIGLNVLGVGGFLMLLGKVRRTSSARGEAGED
jgi:hypothetical protein